jgi:hypothetical protein
MRPIDPVEQDLERHLRAMEIREAARDARIASFSKDFDTVIEALRDSTWTAHEALHEVFVAYARTRDDAALGRAVRKLVDTEIITLAEDE